MHIVEIVFKGKSMMTTQAAAPNAGHAPQSIRRRRSLLRRRVLLLMLVVLVEISSMGGCCWSLPMQQAFVAQHAGSASASLSPWFSYCTGGSFAKSYLNRNRLPHAGAGLVTAGPSHRKSLGPLHGPNGSHDSTRRSTPSSSAANDEDGSGGCSQDVSDSRSRRSRQALAGLARMARTSRKSSLSTAIAQSQRLERERRGRRTRRRRGGGRGRVGRRPRDERQPLRREGGWRRLAAAVREGGSSEGGERRSEGSAADVGSGSTTDGGDDDGRGIGKGGNDKSGSWVERRWRYALAKIKSEPLQILTIPISAACVGWITNKLAVEMIFHPLVWRGIPLRVVDGQPLGLFGWQGIVPAKAGVMAERMVDMVTTQLVDVEEVFRRLSPGKVARLLGPEIDSIVQNVYEDVAPSSTAWLPGSFASGLVPQAVDELKGLRRNMLVGITKDMQKQVTQVLDVKEMVVGEMLRDRSLMVSLFQRCGKAEFKFLVNSGFFFGFLLGVVQMFVWLLYDKPWTLPTGGAVVGYITNWMAIKLIFEPVDPVKMGPFVLQGLFLKRQDEVAADFAEFFSSNVLTSKKLWKSMIDGPKAEAFQELVAGRVVPFVSRASAVAGANLDPLTVKSLAARAAAKLGDHVHVLHDYTDKTLALRETMTLQMQKMSTRTFEGVLHPVFQEEEATLIVAGAILGAIAGFLQMLLSTKGVRDAAKKAASVAAEKAAAATDGVVGGVGTPVQAGAQAAQAGAQAVQAGAQVAQARAQAAQKAAAGWGGRARCVVKRCKDSACAVAVTAYRWLSDAGRAAAAAVADRYHRRRRRGGGDSVDSVDDGSDER